MSSGSPPIDAQQFAPLMPVIAGIDHSNATSPMRQFADLMPSIAGNGGLGGQKPKGELTGRALREFAEAMLGGTGGAGPMPTQNTPNWLSRLGDLGSKAMGAEHAPLIGGLAAGGLGLGVAGYAAYKAHKERQEREEQEQLQQALMQSVKTSSFLDQADQLLLKQALRHPRVEVVEPGPGDPNAKARAARIAARNTAREKKRRGRVVPGL